MSELTFRKATVDDLDDVFNIISIAKRNMRASGNTVQWEDDYPTRDYMRNDILTNDVMLVLEDDKPVACFTLAKGEDPTYAIINGAWLNDLPYVALHRFAVAEPNKGIGKKILTWAANHCKNVRIDTHELNGAMKKILQQTGYTYCGKITGIDGMERIAYQITTE